MLARGEAAEYRDDPPGEWGARECPRAAGQSNHGEWGGKKKAGALAPVTQVVVEGCCPEAMPGEVRRGEAAAVEERGSFGQSKAPQRWWWQALDHLTRGVLA